MPSSLTAYFGTATDISATHGSLWNNSSNAVGVEDGSYSTSTTSGGSNTLTDILYFSDWQESVPGDATINGIVIAIYGHASVASNGNGSGNLGLLTSAVTQVGATKPNVITFPLSDSWMFAGGPSDEWGASLSSAVINRTSFGFGVQILNTTVNCEFLIDAAKMTVYFTPSGVLHVERPGVRIYTPDDRFLLEEC